MFKAIIYNLKTPHKIPFKIIKKITDLFERNKYRQDEFETTQNKTFNELNLDRVEAKKKLNIIKKKYIFLDREMSSEHELLFSAASLRPGIEIKNILEIGTFDGYNAFLLSKIFLNSRIDTIDLPDNDYDFKNFYNRRNSIENFIKKRDDILSKSDNINFFRMNSLKLINHKKKYDLIWIDGAHGYPVVCIDIINSLNLLNEGGLILCDDVYLNLKYKNSDRMYNSLASYETLNELEKQNLIFLKLIFKRIDPKYNSLKNERKFVAIFRKI